MSFISRQPNGLLCRFSEVVDTVTHYNMTDEDYMNGITGTVETREQGKDIIDNYLRDFSKVNILLNNETHVSRWNIYKSMKKEVLK